MTAEQIGTCPFCGRPVYVDMTDEEGNYSKEPGYAQDPYSGLWFVLVHNHIEDVYPLCSITRGEDECLGVIYATKEEAIAAWNTRVEPLNETKELPVWLKEEINSLICTYQADIDRIDNQPYDLIANFGYEYDNISQQQRAQFCIEKAVLERVLTLHGVTKCLK